MANKTISDLTFSIDSKDSDVLLIEDGSTTMKITKGTLLQECSKEGHGHLISDIDTLQEALDDKLDYVILAPVATSGSYADLTDTPTIPTKVSELQNDNKYLVAVPSEYVTEQELAAELAQKSDAGHIHSYGQITGVPTIPTKVSELKNDKNYVTQNELNPQLQQKSDIGHHHSYGEITGVPTIPTKVSELENDNEYLVEEDLVKARTTIMNNPISVAEIIGVAKSYYNVRYKEDGTPLFIYNTTYTPTGDSFNVNNETYGGAIDCSTFVGLVLRGLPVEKSPYAPLLEGTTSDSETEIEDDVSSDATTDNDGNDTNTWHSNSVIANKNDYNWAVNPFEWSLPVVPGGESLPIRRASQLGQWMLERGMAIPLDSTFSNVEPGDIIFWAKKDSNGNYNRQNRFMHISHVAICASKKPAPVDDPAFPSGYPWKHTMYEVTTISPYVLNRTLEKTSPDTVVLVCRPDLGCLVPGHFAGNINTTWGVTDISTVYRPGIYYLTSSVTGGLPTGVTSGICCTLKVERTLTSQGKTYSLIQTLINTNTNEAEYRRTQYCYSHAPNVESWTEWTSVEERLTQLEQIVAELSAKLSEE